MLSGSGFLPAVSAAPDTTLLSASFDSGTDGFIYQDDTFGTSQPNYASGTRVTSGGYNGTGGLQVTLGGGDATAISGMSGGWNYTLNLAAAETGVALAFRYKLDQTATYEFDEYTRLLVKVDATQYGRGTKSYVDQIGGDGSSSQGNSNTYLPTSEWQQFQIYLGNLAAGSHAVTLGGYNNHKDAADESTSVTLDDVVITSGNPPPAINDVQLLVNRLDVNQFKAFDQNLASFGDRCRMSSCPNSPANSFTNAQNWVAQQLTAMGYSPQKVNFTYSGFSGTNLWATKVGTVHPDQMYIISAHLDGRGGGQAADDDGSGVSLLLEAARILAADDVRTDISVRFIFWDNEESGMYGAYGYVQDRRSLQGQENPTGSGLFPEPTWLGLIQHDMLLYDHGAGTAGSSQSAYADLDIEWRAGTIKETDSKALALKWRFLNGTYATDYPADAYSYSTNTDDTAFQPYVASVSVRENRRSLTSGSNAEWISPYYHTTNDQYANYSAADFQLGFNAVQATLGTVAELAGAHLTTSSTPTATNTVAPTNTSTNTPVPTNTSTNTPVATDTVTSTPVPTSTPTNTPIPTEMPTSTPTPTNTAVPTSTATNTPMPTNTPTNTPTSTPIPTETPTSTPVPPNTPTTIPVPTSRATNTSSPTSTPIIDRPQYRLHLPIVAAGNHTTVVGGYSKAEWINPYCHTTSDIESSYTRDDDGDGECADIELGCNAARTTFGLVAELASAHLTVPAPIWTNTRSSGTEITCASQPAFLSYEVCSSTTTPYFAVADRWVLRDGVTGHQPRRYRDARRCLLCHVRDQQQEKRSAASSPVGALPSSIAPDS
jgi:hypothetical protein